MKSGGVVEAAKATKSVLVKACRDDAGSRTGIGGFKMTEEVKIKMLTGW